MADTVENLQAAIAMMASIEPAARQQLAEELGDLGMQALAMQMAEAPVRTGRLRDALTIAQAVASLRVRIGYPDMKSGKDRRFYAVMQEYGVKAGSQKVTRINRRAGRTVQKGRTKVYPRSTYTMSWPARPGRPFVHLETRFDRLLLDVQDRFWDKALTRVDS
jgi:hypothetical protein